MGINFEILDNKNQPQGNKSVRNVKKNPVHNDYLCKSLYFCSPYFFVCCFSCQNGSLAKQA